MIGQKFFENLGESANPVFIKEMRQYFQNRRMVFLMGLLLLVEFICTLFFSSASDYTADGTRASRSSCSSSSAGPSSPSSSAPSARSSASPRSVPTRS